MFKFPFFAYKYNSLIIVIEASEKERFEKESLNKDLVIHLVPIHEDLEILDILAMSESKILVIRQLSQQPDAIEEKIIRHLLLKGAQVWDVSPFDQSISLNTELSKYRRRLSPIFTDEERMGGSLSEFSKSITEIIGLFFLGPILLSLALFFELKGMITAIYNKIKQWLKTKPWKKRTQTFLSRESIGEKKLDDKVIDDDPQI